MKAAVGLGNPDPEYSGTRHNAGFMVLDRVAEECDGSFDRRAHESSVASCEVGEARRTLLLVKPLTYMNRSGEAVRRLVESQGLEGEDLIVVHDDLDLPLGRVKVSFGVGDGGHRGLKSIIAALQSQDFGRVRVGIGRPQGNVDSIQYVLSKFANFEYACRSLDMAAEALVCVVEEGYEKAMTKFNGRRLCSGGDA